jgi:hypothetical protein
MSESTEELMTKFSVPIEVSSWRDGYSFKIFDVQQMLELVEFDERFEF